ncbi:hypothetical protein EJB05_54709, partial [Eragrostis curvula]
MAESPECSSAREPATAAGDNGGHGFRSEPSIEDRLENLKLHGEEEIDLDFSGELEDLIKENRWMALFKVHTTKSFSHAALLKQMRNAWSSAKEITFKVMGSNLFLVQFQCLGDWNRVMDGGPWIFRGSSVILQEYDGFSNVYEYKLDKIPVWARIQGVPEGLMKKKELAEKVAKKVGGPPLTVIVNEGKINPLKYLRARVFIDVAKPLVRFVPITIKEQKKYPVLYEKLPAFCFFCGCIGHEMDECGDGVHNEKDCEWGDWLLADFDSNSTGGPFNRPDGRAPSTGGGLRGGSRGRGRGRGRGGYVNDYDMSEAEDDLEDTEDPMTALTIPRKRMVRSEGKVDSDGSSKLPGQVAANVKKNDGDTGPTDNSIGRVADKTSNGRDVRVSLCSLAAPPSTSWVQLYTDDEVSMNPTIVSADGDHLLIHMIVADEGMFKAKYPHNFFVYRADLDRPCLWPLPPPSGCISSNHTGIARNGEGSRADRWEMKQIGMPYDEDAGLVEHGWETDAMFSIDGFIGWADYHHGIMFCNVFSPDPELRFLRFPVVETSHGYYERGRPTMYRTVSNCRGHLLFVDVNNGRDNRCVIREYGSRCSIMTWTLRMPQLQWELDATLLPIQDFWSSPSYRDSHLPRTVTTFPVVSLQEANIVHFVVKAWVVTVDM